MSFERYPFRYRDRLTGRWIKARYKATREEIAARHEEWQIVGPAEIRSTAGGAFHPYRMVPYAEVLRLQEAPPQISPHLERPPAIDAKDGLLVGIFLRRYVIYCARRRRFAQMEGAARLFNEVATAQKCLSAARACGDASHEPTDDK